MQLFRLVIKNLLEKNAQTKTQINTTISNVLDRHWTKFYNMTRFAFLFTGKTMKIKTASFFK